MSDSVRSNVPGDAQLAELGELPTMLLPANSRDLRAAAADGPPTAKELAVLYEGMAKWEAERKLQAEKMERHLLPVTAGTRRFDLATFLLASSIFAFLVAALRWAGSPPILTMYLVGLLPIVGIAQAILFNGQRPQWAAVVAGASYSLAIGLFFLQGQWPGDASKVGYLLTFYTVAGAAFGVVAGALVNSVFYLPILFRRPRLQAFESNVELTADSGTCSATRDAVSTRTEI